jgi:Protein of unknown function (DUF4013)
MWSAPEAIISRVRLVAESFAWPFRARLSTWLWGCVCVVLLPVLFVPLLGYAVTATRSSELDPEKPPPPWRISGEQLRAGAWISLVVILSLAPFAIALNPLAGAFGDSVYWHVAAFFVLLFMWGLLALLVFPHTTAAFAASGSRTDLFDGAGALRRVRSEFSAWNLVVAAIVTSWAIGIACAGLLCVGLVPGIFYAILVSAHATATLHQPHPEGSHPSAG